MKWNQISGNELDERVTFGQSLSEVLPNAQAIYVWRRHLRPPPGAVGSASLFRAWVDSVLAVPLASLGTRELSHYASLIGLRLGGQGLNPEKLSTLEQLSKNNQGRKYVAAFIQSLAPVVPALYVGEASKLDERIRQHVSGETPLRDLLKNELSLTFSDVDLSYYPLPSGNPEAAKALRTFFETVTTKLTIASCVQRIG